MLNRPQFLRAVGDGAAAGAGVVFGASIPTKVAIPSLLAAGVGFTGWKFLQAARPEYKTAMEQMGKYAGKAADDPYIKWLMRVAAGGQGVLGGALKWLTKGSINLTEKVVHPIVVENARKGILNLGAELGPNDVFGRPGLFKGLGIAYPPMVLDFGIFAPRIENGAETNPVRLEIEAALAAAPDALGLLNQIGSQFLANAILNIAFGGDQKQYDAFMKLAGDENKKPYEYYVMRMLRRKVLERFLAMFPLDAAGAYYMAPAVYSQPYIQRQAQQFRQAATKAVNNFANGPHPYQYAPPAPPVVVKWGKGQVVLSGDWLTNQTPIPVAQIRQQVGISDDGQQKLDNAPFGIKAYFEEQIAPESLALLIQNNPNLANAPEWLLNELLNMLYQFFLAEVDPLGLLRPAGEPAMAKVMQGEVLPASAVVAEGKLEKAAIFPGADKLTRENLVFITQLTDRIATAKITESGGVTDEKLASAVLDVKLVAEGDTRSFRRGVGQANQAEATNYINANLAKYTGLITSLSNLYDEVITDQRFKDRVGPEVYAQAKKSLEKYIQIVQVALAKMLKAILESYYGADSADVKNFMDFYQKALLKIGNIVPPVLRAEGANTDPTFTAQIRAFYDGLRDAPILQQLFRSFTGLQNVLPVTQEVEEQRQAEQQRQERENAVRRVYEQVDDFAIFFRARARNEGQIIVQSLNSLQAKINHPTSADWEVNNLEDRRIEYNEAVSTVNRIFPDLVNTLQQFRNDLDGINQQEIADNPRAIALFQEANDTLRILEQNWQRMRAILDLYLDKLRQLGVDLASEYIP